MLRLAMQLSLKKSNNSQRKIIFTVKKTKSSVYVYMHMQNITYIFLWRKKKWFFNVCTWDSKIIVGPPIYQAIMSQEVIKQIRNKKENIKQADVQTIFFWFFFYLQYL